MRKELFRPKQDVPLAEMLLGKLWVSFKSPSNPESVFFLSSWVWEYGTMSEAKDGKWRQAEEGEVRADGANEKMYLKGKAGRQTVHGVPREQGFKWKRVSYWPSAPCDRLQTRGCDAGRLGVGKHTDVFASQK